VLGGRLRPDHFAWTLLADLADHLLWQALEADQQQIAGFPCWTIRKLDAYPVFTEKWNVEKHAPEMWLEGQIAA
jgi:hypothetical protein